MFIYTHLYTLSQSLFAGSKGLLSGRKNRKSFRSLFVKINNNLRRLVLYFILLPAVVLDYGYGALFLQTWRIGR